MDHDPSEPSLLVAHVSDLHVGAHDERTLGGLSQDLRHARAAATILTGDLTMRARTREFARAAQVIATFPAPTMVVIGNHDIPLTNPIRRMSSPYAKFRAGVTPELDPVLDLDGARIQGLGSMPRWRWKSGRVSDRQARLIRQTFAGAPVGTARIVAMHHPPSSQALEAIAGGPDLERALVDAEVDIVLAGHTHVPSVRVLHLRSGERARSVIEVVAGTATSDRTRGTVPSWSLLEIGPRTLTVIERFAEGATWRTAEPVVHALAAGTHRPTPTT